MSVSVVKRLFAFFDNVWAFILTLVRSLLALFSSRRRSSDPFTLPSVSRTPRDVLVRTHARLRPILLTPGSIALSATQRAQSTRSRSATSTLFPVHDDHAAASGSTAPPSGPERTSPKLDPHDPELGLSAAPVHDNAPGPSEPGSAASATNSRDGTPDTSLPTTHTASGSLSVVPLTPPDRCYLVPVPSVTDCPYAEPWPANAPIDRNKLKLPGSPLKVLTHHNTNPILAEPIVKPIGSPPPGRWNPGQIWTSTPYRTENHPVPGPPISPFDDHPRSSTNPLIDISNALMSRSRSSVIQPYDDTSNSSTSSDAGLFTDTAAAPNLRPTRLSPRARLARSYQYQSYPRFIHHLDPHAYAWRRHHGGHLPGKLDRRTVCANVSGSPIYPRRTRSHADLLTLAFDKPTARAKTMTECWYHDDAYISSPVSALSPPPLPRRLGPSRTVGSPSSSSNHSDEDSDLMPLGRLRERLVRQNLVRKEADQDQEHKPHEQEQDWLHALLLRRLSEMQRDASHADAVAPLSRNT